MLFFTNIFFTTIIVFWVVGLFIFKILFRANGGLFVVPMTHIDPVLVPEIREGLVVSFEFENYSRSEAPVNPKITRIRSDVKWEEVVYESGGDRLGLSPFARPSSPFLAFSRLFSPFLAFSRLFSPFLAFSRFFSLFLAFSRFFSSFSRFFSLFLAFSRFFSLFLAFSRLFSLFLAVYRRPF
jgi:hypothetical protein